MEKTNKKSDEIERKWFVKDLPNLNNLQAVHYERYFLPAEKDKEIRVQLKGDRYELEELTRISDLSRSKSKREITQKEFEEFKAKAKTAIVRDSYLFSQDPEISIKIYSGIFKGLVRVEVEFKSEEQAKSFEPLDWFGQELTNTLLGNDSQLVQLSEKEFKDLLDEYSK